MSFLRSLTPAALACLLLLLPAGDVLAQGEGRQTFGDLTGFDLNPLQGMTRLSRMNDLVPMEGAVNPDRYIVGPGDMFDVSVGGAQPVIASVPVSADGYLLLPEAGAIEVAGRRLSEARLLARQALRQEFENVNVEVTLSQPRQFYVHVSGAIPVPGRYVATPVARVATVLNMAFADTTRAPVSNPDLRPSLRNLKLIHQDGTSERVDLLKYYSTGNTEHNPYLTDGDVISVPTYNPDYHSVFISGDVAFPGTYDYRPDDTVYDLLVLATGENPPNGFTQVRVLRTDEDGRSTSNIYQLADLDGSVQVSPRDQIHAVQDVRRRGSAAVEGWVAFPGQYPIVAGETTLQSLLEMAGGLRDGALARGAFLVRPTLPAPEPQLSRRNRFEPSPSGRRLFRTDSLALMASTRLSQMDFMSRAYFVHELRLQNRVPIDLSTVAAGDPMYMQDGDRLFVPRDENNVFVLGQVNRPGYVTYRPNAPLEYYIEASGGYSANAGDAFVIEAGTGRYVDAERALVRSGDRIFIDRDIARADDAELQRLLLQDRRADLDERSRTVQNIVQSISAATAIVTTYLLIRREFSN